MCCLKGLGTEGGGLELRGGDWELRGRAEGKQRVYILLMCFNLDRISNV